MAATPPTIIDAPPTDKQVLAKLWEHYHDVKTINRNRGGAPYKFQELPKDTEDKAKNKREKRKRQLRLNEAVRYIKTVDFKIEDAQTMLANVATACQILDDRLQRKALVIAKAKVKKAAAELATKERKKQERRERRAEKAIEATKAKAKKPKATEAAQA